MTIKPEYLDEVIQQEIGQGLLEHAKARVEFRKMRALESIAQSLNAIVLNTLPVGCARPAEQRPNICGNDISPEKQTT